MLLKLFRRCLKSRSISFNDYEYHEILDIHNWKRCIKKYFMFTDIPWSSKYDALIEDMYELYNDIPFHNQKHVYDVFQLGVCLLVQNKNTFHSLTNIQKLTYCIALLCHDMDHKGQTNAEIREQGNIHEYDYEYDEDEFYGLDSDAVKRQSSYESLASICSSSSYNERHHITCGNRLLRKHKIIYDEELFMKLISYTDLVVHNTFMNNNHTEEDEMLVLFMKLADIGHILRKWNIHLDFVTALNRERPIPLDPKLLPEDTLWFNNNFVLPLIEKTKEFNDTMYTDLLHYYNMNVDKWKNIHRFVVKTSA